MLYCLEVSALTKRQERELEVAAIKMLRVLLEVTGRTGLGTTLLRVRLRLDVLWRRLHMHR